MTIMSAAPAAINREAKGTHQALKEALKTREPWDREVDFQRRNLRRQYLHLLLAHPYAKESKDAETYLWMQTSYTFISMYKQHIHALQRTGNPPPPPRSHSNQQQQHHTGHGAVEYRKFLQRFRQFLAEEEKFWALLVVRFCRTFALDEAQPVLVALGIQPATHDLAGSTVTAEAGDSHQGATITSTSAALTTVQGSNNTNSNGIGRGHALFPPEDSTASVKPQTPVQRAARFAILTKALVCLGDIARYRELYNESGGRPKAGQEEGIGVTVRGKAVRGKRGQGHDGALAAIGRARNYDRAQLCYEQARLLVPSEGNASHQLAILASYKKDAFGSLVHYYRALCVRQPYDTASENLGTVLSKALEQWRARARKEKSAGASTKEGEQGASVPLVPWKRVELLKEKVVVLHALWRLGVEKMDAISPKHAKDVRNDFHALVSEKGLPPDMISKMVILSQGALWKHRMIREPTASGSPKDSGDDPLPAKTTMQSVENRMLGHVLSIYQALMQVGLSELTETPEDAAENDLAQRITAPFRRTLPALRIASKWLRANYRYVVQNYMTEETGSGKGKEGRGSFSTAAAAGEELSIAVMQFWTKYAEFSTLLWRTFPPERLPALSAPLEEDVDMRGFLPLRHMMGAGGDDPTVDLPSKIGSGDPNEEQLMRIADLQNDAKFLAEMEESLVEFSRNEFVLRRTSTSSGAKRGQSHQSSRIISGNELFTMRNDAKERDEDVMTETTSRTDDDPIRLAFQTALDGNAHLDDDDEDQIVWDPRASPIVMAIPPVLPTSPIHTSPISPMKPTLSPIGIATRSPTLTKGQSPFTSPLTAPSPTTAQDLLNNVMGIPRVSGNGNSLGIDPYRSHVTESSAPQPQLLFGSGPPNQPGHSIWSTTLDDQSITFTGKSAGSSASTHIGTGNGNVFHSAQHQQLFPSTSSQEFAQSIWSSLYPKTVSTSTQGHVPPSISTSQSLAPFTLPLHDSTSHITGRSGLPAHQRTLSSSSASIAQLPTSHHQKHNSDDPFLYSTMPLGSTRQHQQHQQQLQQLQSVIRPIGTQLYSTPLDAYSGSSMDSDGMRYGNDGLGNYHRDGHTHQPKVGHAYAGPLSSIWGNT